MPLCLRAFRFVPIAAVLGDRLHRMAAEEADGLIYVNYTAVAFSNPFNNAI